MGMLRSWHREILKRIWKAIPSDLKEIFLEQEILGGPQRIVQIYVVVLNRSLDKAIMVDVTIPFEGEESSFQTARSTKETKYSALKTWLQS